MKTQYDKFVMLLGRLVAVAGVLGVAACATSNVDSEYTGGVATPTVDYVESLDVYSAPHSDSFLNQLAMNYRSYAIYNARTSGFPDVGELFANKAVSAFSGEVPFPENMDNWRIENERSAYDLSTAYNEMIELFQDDLTAKNPELAAELQAKYDCWLSATATGQLGTAKECRSRFEKTLAAIRDCKGGKIVNNSLRSVETLTSKNEKVMTAGGENAYYPETAGMAAMRGANRAREGLIIVNNVNIPERLINPEPVSATQPLVFNQNIYGGDKTFNKTLNDNSGSNNVTDSGNTVMGGDCPCRQRMNAPMDFDAPQYAFEQMEDCGCDDEEEEEEIVVIGEELVTRQEFINMMMAMRAELAAINSRLDTLAKNEPVARDETTVIKVQQIPVEPKQHVMEEVFEIQFDFNKATIKPEYQNLIRQLVDVTQNNRNVRVSVVGHTDTVGTQNYNYALGGRRAEAVQKMLIEYGIPSSQIVAVSAGEEDLKVPTPDGVPNAENRRVRVVKEVTYTDANAPTMVPVADVSVEQFVDSCDGDCED